MSEQRASGDCLLGIDIGTTGAKTLLCRAADGAVLATGFAPYPLYHPQPRWAEQDPRARSSGRASSGPISAAAPSATRSTRASG